SLSREHPKLLSFPTRRSSDLGIIAGNENFSGKGEAYGVSGIPPLAGFAGGGGGRCDALVGGGVSGGGAAGSGGNAPSVGQLQPRSEEHTSELQSRFDLVCRLL